MERGGEERRGDRRRGEERRGEERRGECLCEIQKWETPPHDCRADSG